MKATTAGSLYGFKKEKTFLNRDPPTISDIKQFFYYYKARKGFYPLFYFEYRNDSRGALLESAREEVQKDPFRRIK